MVTYPTGPSQVSEEYATTPTHGGTVTTGHEYDMAITEKTGADQSQPPPTTVQPAPVQKRPGGSSQRPRPVSMPPQSYGQSNGPVPAERERPTTEESSKRQQTREQSTSRVSRGSSRVLGDYTLGKTLGAGSMGKVKLAQHAGSDEKVRPSFQLLGVQWVLMDRPSSLSRFCLALFPSETRVLRLQQRQPPRMLPRKFGHYERPPYPCFYTTPTSVACGR